MDIDVLRDFVAPKQFRGKLALPQAIKSINIIVDLNQPLSDFRVKSTY
jgi:hypothetical protein